MIRRVLLVGSQLGLADQSDTCLLDALRQTGCTVKAFDYRATTFIPRWFSRLIPGWLRWFTPRRLPAVAQRDDTAANARFVQQVKRFQPQLIIALQAERLTPASLCHAREAGAVLINWMHDEPQGRVDTEVVPLYDCWVVWDASVSGWLIERGAKRVEHLPVACDPVRHYPVELSESEKKQWASRICFVGGFQPNREALLSAVADLGLAIWGPGWNQASDDRLKSCVRSTQAIGRMDWLKAYAAADIVVNIHSQGKEGLNFRVWEALAAQTCLVSDWRADIDRFLKGFVSTFSSPQQLRQRCEELLADEARRRSMARQAREHVLSQHTFHHRARQILALAEDCRGRRLQ